MVRVLYTNGSGGENCFTKIRGARIIRLCGDIQSTVEFRVDNR
jgi:hypothetical protein